MLCVIIFFLSMCYALVLVFAISTFFFSISIIMVFPTVCLDEIIVCSFVVVTIYCTFFASTSLLFECVRIRAEASQKLSSKNKSLIKPGIISSTKTNE